MAYDSEARDAGNSGIAIGVIALVLIAAVAGFIYLQQGSAERVAVIDRGAPSTTVIQPPAVQSPPVVNINPAPAAPSSGSSGTGSSDSGSSSGSSASGGEGKAE